METLKLFWVKYGTGETQVTQEEMLLTWTVENREEVRLPDNIVDIVDIADIVDIVDIVELFRQYRGPANIDWVEPDIVNSIGWIFCWKPNEDTLLQLGTSPPKY